MEKQFLWSRHVIFPLFQMYYKQKNSLEPRQNIVPLVFVLGTCINNDKDSYGYSAIYYCPSSSQQVLKKRNKRKGWRQKISQCSHKPFRRNASFVRELLFMLRVYQLTTRNIIGNNNDCVEFWFVTFFSFQCSTKIMGFAIPSKRSPHFCYYY